MASVMAIDWMNLSMEAEGLPYRLGLTVLPGKHGASVRYTGRIYRGVLAHDLATLRSANVRRLILLVEDAELERWGDPQIVSRGCGAGIEIVRHPMPDGGVPSSMEVMDEILVQIREARRHGNVGVACMGGVGRTGMVAACALVEAGASPRDAIERVRRVRHPEAVETLRQESFVAIFADHLARRAGG